MAYADWKAPGEDSEFLIWPEPQDLIDQTRQNHQHLSQNETLVGGLPLRELRTRQRQWLGHTDEQPLIASGHQTELYHAGVWVKDVLAEAVAGKIDGAAYHFAVDTDQPKHLQLKWMTVEGSAADAPHEVQAFPVTDDPELSTASWAALLNAPTPAHVATVSEALEKSRFTFQPLLADFLLSMRRLAIEAPDLANALTNATHELNWSMGMRHHALLCSPMFSSEPYLAFVHHILSRCLSFAAHYNDALGEYRVEQKIKNASRPMPDLHVTPTSIEVPFWLDDLTDGRRERAQVWRDGERLYFVAPGGEELPLRADAEGWDAAKQLGDFLKRNRLRLSPRALTLTLFLRLLVVDNFIHGIGGGRYDQVTDRLIRSHFGIKPPKFAVTTATLYFPDALGRTRSCLPCVAREGHHLKHSILGPRKRELVTAIAEAPRHSLSRRQLFTQLHQELAEAAVNNPELSRWEEHLRQSQQRSVEEQTLFDRELFFGVQPRERLIGLIEQYASRFARG
ncbi:MAG TPA: hypothetical protein VF669_02320 [Tepidisphaeraceae bacterium]|jgi:hypothetical protein